MKTSNSIYLTNENDFTNAVALESSKSIKKLVKVKNYTGFIEYHFAILNMQFVAIDVGENQDMEHVIEVDLFNKKFKGIIVKDDEATIIEKGNCLQYIEESKFIDVSRGCHFRTVHEEKKHGYIKIRKSSPIIYGLSMQRVQINGAECMQIKKSIQHDNSKKHYVEIRNIKVIYNFSSIQYHNQVIIKPEFIFKYENITNSTLKPNDKVRFKDSSEIIYQGQVLWIGKVNDDVSAVIVSIEKNQLTDVIKQYVLDEFTMETHFKVNKSGICVGHFAIVTDVITYKKCKTSNLEVVDPKFLHPYQKESSEEKLLVFKLNGVLNAVTLKWKGRIYNQLCMGCELSYKSEEGSNGIYGTEKLFDCAPKKGVLITSEKLNDQEITDLCEYNNHKSLQFISTELGFKIYDQTSICCIENLDGIDLGNENLKIGCKIMFQGGFIGICKFIGKVNCKPSIGIELNRDDINEIPVVFDFINFFVLQNGKLCFMDLDIVDIGTFYSIPPEISHSYSECSHNTMVIYHPGNDPNKCFPGEVKYYGKYENGNMVYGIDLEYEVTENCSPYFLENIFSYKPKHGVIDDEYKIEYNTAMEIGNSVLPKSSEDYSKIYEKIINRLLNGKDMEVVDDLIMHFSNDFINYAKANKEMLKPENLEPIINGLYEKGNIKLINDILNSIENKNEIFPFLKSLLSKCIKDKKFDCISDILTRVTTFQKTDDDNNQNCLNLAMECLENMNEENKKDYQLTYESFIGLCGNHECYIDDENVKETFITKIILNKSISENIIIDVLKFEIFNVNQLNSNSKSPMELTIDKCRSNILEALFDSETLNTDKLKPIYDEFIINCSNLTHEQLLMIPIMKRKLDKMEQKSNSMCGTKEPGVSN